MVKKKLAQMATSGVVKIIVEDNLHRLRTRETKIIHNFEEKRNDELKKKNSEMKILRPLKLVRSREILIVELLQFLHSA